MKYEFTISGKFVVEKFKMNCCCYWLFCLSLLSVKAWGFHLLQRFLVDWKLGILNCQKIFNRDCQKSKFGPNFWKFYIISALHWSVYIILQAQRSPLAPSVKFEIFLISYQPCIQTKVYFHGNWILKSYFKSFVKVSVYTYICIWHVIGSMKAIAKEIC